MRVLVDSDVVIEVLRGRPPVADAFRRLYASSSGLELGDALMAAVATIHDLPLWTLNVRHYRSTGARLFRQ